MVNLEASCGYHRNVILDHLVSFGYHVGIFFEQFYDAKHLGSNCTNAVKRAREGRDMGRGGGSLLYLSRAYSLRSPLPSLSPPLFAFSLSLPSPSHPLAPSSAPSSFLPAAVSRSVLHRSGRTRGAGAVQHAVVAAVVELAYVAAPALFE